MNHKNLKNRTSKSPEKGKDLKWGQEQFGVDVEVRKPARVVAPSKL
jgi:hypothetical protein